MHNLYEDEMMNDVETTVMGVGIRPKYKILYDQEKEVEVNSTEADGRIMIKSIQNLVIKKLWQN